MKLSVIIPTFNRCESLPRAIDSVFKQTVWSNWAAKGDCELLVIDDGSTDDSEQMLNSRYPNLRYIQQRNSGVSAARNLGLKHAQGEWVALLDSDDEWLPHKLDLQFSALQQSKLKVCHTEEIWVRNGVRVNQMHKHQKTGGDIFIHCLPLCVMSPSSIVLHASVLENVGNFDEALPACEDYDLWLRITSEYSVAYVEEACIRKYGGHEDQLSRAFWGMDRFRVIALEKILTHNQTRSILTDEQSKAALYMLVKKNKILLQGARKHGNASLQASCEARMVAFGL